jgi:hypothetical protein
MVSMAFFSPIRRSDTGTNVDEIYAQLLIFRNTTDNMGLRGFSLFAGLLWEMGVKGRVLKFVWVVDFMCLGTIVNYEL